MNKYGFYRDFYCLETKEYIRIPHDDAEETIEKYAQDGLTLEEVKDPYEPDTLRIVQPG